MGNFLKLLFFSVTAFVSLFVFARILGKKQIAQLSFVDYCIGISLGSIAAEMAFDTGSRPFYYYIIAMAVFFVLAFLLNTVGRKGIFFKRIFNGKPTMVIYEGKVVYKGLARVGLDINELLSLLRGLGYFDINHVYYALIEPNGQLSVLPLGAERPVVAKDLPIKPDKAQLPNHLVSDGIISRSGLSELGKDEKWLLSELDIKDKKKLKEIILASYDYRSKKVVVHYKDTE